MKLTQKTIRAILDTASPWIHTDSAGASFTLICTVDEGLACRFAQPDWRDKTLDRLAPAIVAELGWKRIEHAPQRQVVVRCSVPGRDPARAVCEIDRGDGFIGIPVSAT